MPFIAAGMIWAGVSVVLIASRSGTRTESIAWFAGIWLAALLDLFSIAMALSGAIELVAGRQIGQKSIAATKLMLWGAIKLVCLALLGFIVWKGRSIPVTGLLLGLATLFIVPVTGGLWWLHREKGDAGST